MSEPIISVRELGKRYRIGVVENSAESWRQATAGFLLSPFRYLRQMSRPPTEAETLWALRDVSFDIARGEVLGIVGRNGAGKSTLLKILSRITEPTEGRAHLNGRVGSLLEVGTGFHPELTGRENVYLNGTILGMRKREVERKFDEIVAFAEVEKFIDTPVKRYSSGMAVRLAFAVAAHLEPEILIVDEVLAVGDGAFQQKCLDKMQKLMAEGRTILFVSHNMPTITRLCQRAIWIEEGHILQDGLAEPVVTAYQRSVWRLGPESKWPDAADAPGNAVVRLRRARVRTEQGDTAEAINIEQPVGIEITYEVLQADHVLVPNFHFYNEAQLKLFAVQDVLSEWRRRPRPPGTYVTTVWLPGNFLAEGTLMVDVAVSSHVPDNRVHFFERRAVAFHVNDSLNGTSARGDFAGTMDGVVRPLVDWETKVCQP